MNRNDVKKLYKDLPPAEAYGVFLAAVARNDVEGAKTVVRARPTAEFALRRSELMEYHEGFAAMAGVVERELLAAAGRLAVIRAARARARLQATAMAEFAREMYLAGVAAGAAANGVTPEDEAKAEDIFNVTRLKGEALASEWDAAEAAAHQLATNVVHAFDAACATVGLGPDSVANAHRLVDWPSLDEFREAEPSVEAMTLWRDTLLGAFVGQ